ncbi:carbohydrate kinase, partial [Lactobacillus sp. XV13L]|nr:carbohydrate kinase [Lactobacillus sp. XV13L]
RNLSGDFLAMKLIGLKNERPELFKKIYSFTSLSELFALLFCDQLIIEPSQAAETQLFNIFEKRWDKDLTKIFHLDSLLLPKIIPSQSIFRITNKKLLKKFGISGNGCKFVVGGADTQLAMKAVLPEGESQTLCLVSGTTSPVSVRVKDPLVQKNHWLDLDLGGKDYVLEYNPGVTGLNYERSKRLFLPDSSYKDIEEKIDLNTVQSIYASFTTQTFIKLTGGK